MRPALFLDRDGVINEENHYVHRVDDFVFVDGIFELCRNAMAAHMAIVVVTNQAGIGRGYYTEAQFLSLTKWMVARFLEEEVVIDATFFCPYHPENGLGPFRFDSFDRKPNPGMILRAQRHYGLQLNKSVLVGDKESDIAAAKSAGVGRTVLVAPEDADFTIRPDLRVRQLQEANRALF